MQAFDLIMCNGTAGVTGSILDTSPTGRVSEALDIFVSLWLKWRDLDFEASASSY
jgi:hypothetical protein